MLVGRLRPDGPLGGASLDCDDRGRTFTLEGAGEISPARLLDLENRRQLVWGVDQATRERVLGLASAQLRREAASPALARARMSVTAAADAAFEVGRDVHGVPAAPTRFDASAVLPHQGGRVVWTELPVPESRPTNAGMQPHVRRTWVRAIAAAACVAAIAAGVLYFRHAAHWPVLSSTAQVAHYTELYFTDPGTLPTQLRERGPNLLSFTIFNHEGRPRVYRYVITLASRSGSSALGRGSISLAENTGVVTVVRLVPGGRHGPFRITVTIDDPRQTIYFTTRS